MSEFNVGESDGTVEVALTANGMAEFDYTVNLTVNDITTGVCVCVCVFVCVYMWYMRIQGIMYTLHMVVCHNIIVTLLLTNVKTVNFYRSE